MPVKIPQLQEFQRSTNQGGPSQRIRGQALDTTNAVNTRVQGIQKLAGKATEMYVDYENDKIKQLSKAGENEYTFWYQSELSKLKNTEGDPTQAYNEFELRADSKLEEIVNRNDDMSDRVKNSLRSYMSDVELKNRHDFHNQFGVQQQTYENKVYTDNINMHQLNMAKSAGTSDAIFGAELSSMSDSIVERGLKRGIVEALPDDAKEADYVIRNVDGSFSKYKLSNAAKLELVENRSKGIRDSVRALIDAGELEKARQLQEKFKDQLDPREYAKLKSRYKKEDSTKKAYAFFDERLARLPSDQQVELINKQPSEMRDELLKIKDSFDSRNERIRQRGQKQNYETLMNRVLKKQNSDSPYNGIAELESDPIFKKTFDNMNAKQKEAVLSAIKAPKKSSQASIASMQDLIFGKGDLDIRQVSPSEFQQYLVGLNDSDRNRYTKMYEKFNTETSGQERAFYKRGEKFLEQEMVRFELIELNEYGSLDKDDRPLLTEARDELLVYLSEREGVLDDVQLNQFVQAYVKSKVEEVTFTPPTFRKMRPTKSADSRTQNRIENLDKSTMLKYKREFREKFGRFPKKDDPQFIDFVQGKS